MTRGIVWLVLQEGLLLALLGYLLGMGLSRAGLWLLGGFISSGYGYDFSPQLFLPQEGWLLLAAIGLGLVAALLPAIQAFRLNIAQTLARG